MMGRSLSTNAVSLIAWQTSRKPHGAVNVQPCVTMGSPRGGGGCRTRGLPSRGVSIQSWDSLGSTEN